MHGQTHIASVSYSGLMRQQSRSSAPVWPWLMGRRLHPTPFLSVSWLCGLSSIWGTSDIIRVALRCKCVYAFMHIFVCVCLYESNEVQVNSYLFDFSSQDSQTMHVNKLRVCVHVNVCVCHAPCISGDIVSTHIHGEINIYTYIMAKWVTGSS